MTHTKQKQVPKARISIASTIIASLTMLRSSRAFGGLVPSKSRWLSAEPVDVADTDLESSICTGHVAVTGTATCNGSTSQRNTPVLKDRICQDKCKRYSLHRSAFSRRGGSLAEWRIGPVRTSREMHVMGCWVQGLRG